MKKLPVIAGLLLGASLSSAPAASARDVGAHDLLSSSAFPADTLVRKGDRGTPRYIGGTLSSPRAEGVSAQAHAWAFVRRHARLFQLDNPAKQLEVVDVTRDRVGGEHVIFRQMQDGVPVYRAMMAVHMDRAGVIGSVNARILPNLQSSARFVLPEREARQIMADELGPLLVNDAPAELYVRATSAGSDVIAYRVPVFLAHAERGQSPVSMWIDAETGVPLWGEDPIRRGDVSVSGPSVYGDTLEVTGFEGKNFRLDVSPVLRLYVQYAERGAYNLVDQSTRGLGWIYTWDSNETFMIENDFVHSDDDTFDNSRDPGHAAGMSAHYNARRTLDYYDERFGRRGLDDNGMSAASLVQISDPVPTYPLEINAGWAGFGFNFMIYGAGGEWPPDSGVIWSSFSGALDVIGHEFNHAVNEFTVNLGYEHESGALNEHIADVFGVAVQSYWENQDWLIGEGLFAEPEYPYDAVRSFEDPTLYGQPDRMSVFANHPLSYDAGGVHFNSGIGNKAFQLAVDGGAFNGTIVTPIDADPARAIIMATDIWYDVMINRRVDPNSQLIDMRQATVDAARALYPAAVPSLNQAWTAVEVTDDFYPDPSVDVTEPNDYKGVSVQLPVGGSAQGYLWNRADSDIYALTGSGAVDIILSDLAVPAQLAVYKTFIFGQLTSAGTSNNEDTLDEVIHLDLKDGEQYYIEVLIDGAHEGSTDSPYTIQVLPG